MPVKFKGLPSTVLEGQGMPLGQSLSGHLPGKQQVVPTVENPLLPLPSSKRSKGKILPFVLPSRPEIDALEHGPLIQKSAVKPNYIGLESPGKMQ